MPQEETVHPRGLSPGKTVTTIVVLGVLGVFAFLLLTDVLFRFAHPWFGRLTTVLTQAQWVTILLVFLLALVTIAVALVFALRQDQTTLVQLRCPSCEQTFEQTLAELDESGRLECPFCGTQGRLPR